MGRAHYMVTRIPRGMDATIVGHMGDLWDARLGIAAVPSPEEVAWEADATDPLVSAGTLAMQAHETFEAPPHQPRQSRAVLHGLAMAALRKCE